ncbi:MAG TPA: hypothetical protein VJ984_13240 [Xanthomonadales bacterium]|nr:hypothetical protein [Xanthomonadales bacterium]
MNARRITVALRGPRLQHGMTAVELLIAATLAIFMVGSVLLMHLSGRAAYLDIERLSRIQENVRFASDYMIRDIRNAGFRDEAVLRAGHEQQIRTQVAWLNDDEDVLRIRYAGRGHCTEAFDEFRLVENEYSVDSTTGELVCRGRTIPRDAAGNTLITAQDFSTPVGLVGGLSGIGFQMICPDGSSSCSCDIANDLDNACIGVQVALQFEGMREMTGDQAFSDRSIELSALFRNVILNRVNSSVAVASAE